jgi:hypothetical protein
VSRRDTEVVEKNGRWWADYYDVHGQRQRFSQRLPASATKRQALAKLQILKSQRAEARARHRWDAELEQAIERARASKTEATIRKYMDAYRHLQDYLSCLEIKWLGDEN